LPACTGSEFHVAVHGLLVRLMEVLHPGLHRNGTPMGFALWDIIISLNTDLMICRLPIVPEYVAFGLLLQLIIPPNAHVLPARIQLVYGTPAPV
jgi:hypothetical protein